MWVWEREREGETVGSYVMCLSLSGDAQRERTTMIKGQIEEELRQLEDEVAACKWRHTHTHSQFQWLSSQKCLLQNRRNIEVSSHWFKVKKLNKITTICPCIEMFVQMQIYVNHSYDTYKYMKGNTMKVFFSVIFCSCRQLVCLCKGMQRSIFVNVKHERYALKENLSERLSRPTCFPPWQSSAFHGRCSQCETLIQATRRAVVT